MNNFYEILEIQGDVTPQEIKKAYTKLLRKYPPEKEPEQYKIIREAYDILKDEESRKNYDISLKYGKELEQLENSGRKALESEDYDQAIKLFKKMLVLNEDSANARSLLGRAFLKKNKYQKATVEFFKLMEAYPKNVEYICNLGFCYEMAGKLEKAEKLYIKAYNLDIEDKEAATWIINLYWNQKFYSKVESFLKEDIQKDGEVDFNDYYSFSKLIENYIHMNKPYKIIKLVDSVKKIVPNDEEIKNNVAWDFQRLGLILFEAKRYDFAEILLKIAKTLRVEADENLDELIRQSILYKLTANLFNDDKVENFMKGPLFYYMHGDEKTKDDSQKNLDNIQAHLKIYTEECAEVIQNCISRIKTHYKELYLERKDLYNEIDRMNKKQKRIVESTGDFFKSYEITLGLKKMIAGIMDNDDETIGYGLKEMDKENKKNIKSGIIKIRYQYPEIYEISSNFLEKIEKMI
ncbi:MAG: DnaJ domain-containing protein [Cetobacterium sp.]